MNAWFIAATNRDVERMVAEGTLRADLYFRLNVLTLKLPALRERGADVILIAEHSGRQLARRYGLPTFELRPAARAALQAYPWPGNIRELWQVMERALLVSNGAPVTVESLMLPGTAARVDAAHPDLFGLTLEHAEKMLIEDALRRTGDNVSEAARQLGITRMTMRYRMKQHGL